MFYDTRQRSWERFAFVCVLHPIMQELFLTIQRQYGTTAIKHLENDPNRNYILLNQTTSTAMLEEVMSIQRRMMLGCMRDPTATVLTIVMTGLEEALVRCTMVYRDELWDWFTGRSKPTEAEMKHKRLFQIIGAANSMRIEVTCIITSR